MRDEETDDLPSVNKDGLLKGAFIQLIGSYHGLSL